MVPAMCTRNVAKFFWHVTILVNALPLSTAISPLAAEHNTRLNAKIYPESRSWKSGSEHTSSSDTNTNLRILVAKHPWLSHQPMPNGALLWLVEHADTDTVIPISSSPVPGLGDLLVWNNSVFDSTNSKEVAYNSGHCVRTVPGKVWDCQWTLFTPTGNIAASGPFLDEENSTLSITGGTGVYYDARGWLDVGHREPSDATLDFIYAVSFTGGVWDPEKPWAWPQPSY